MTAILRLQLAQSTPPRQRLPLQMRAETSMAGESGSLPVGEGKCQRERLKAEGSSQDSVVGSQQRGIAPADQEAVHPTVIWLS